MEFLDAFMARHGDLPQGQSSAWTPWLPWAMVISDILIAAACIGISLVVLRFLRKRPLGSTEWVGRLCIAFLLALGFAHGVDVVTIWQPAVGLQALAKVVTAGTSIATAIVLWRLLPKALAVPSVRQFESVIESPQAEVDKRHSLEAALSELQQNFAVTLASIDAGFIGVDRRGHVSGMNRVAERVTGWTLAEARGRSLWDVFDREDRPPGYREMNPVDVMLQGDITIDMAHEVVAIARDGMRTTLEVKAALDPRHRWRAARSRHRVP